MKLLTMANRTSKPGAVTKSLTSRSTMQTLSQFLLKVKTSDKKAIKRQVRKSYTREFKLQTLALLEAGRSYQGGKWVQISK